MPIEKISSSLFRFARATAPRARLFCFPYAGGSATAFANWPKRLPRDLEMLAVELPGRGLRRSDLPMSTHMDQLVETLSKEISECNDLPFSLFGHSLGAVVAFSCARSLRAAGAALPAHLFVSARGAPERPNRDVKCAQMNDEELVRELEARGGIAPQILAEPDLISLLLPAVRSDFVLLNSYVYRAGEPLPVPITACGGSKDPLVDPEALSEWSKQTSAAFDLAIFHRGHFFLDEPSLIERVAGSIPSREASAEPQSL